MIAPARTRLSRRAVVLALLAVAALGVHAQPAAEAPAPPDVALWMNAGWGPSSLGPFALNAGASVQYRWVVVSARSTLHVDDGPDAPSESWDNYGDIGLLVGVGHRGRIGHASVTAGVARVRGSHKTRYVEEDCDWFCTRTRADPIGPVVGVPVEVQLFAGRHHFGLGLSAFATFSRVRNYGGVAVNLQLGALR